MSTRETFQAQTGFREEQGAWHKRKLHFLCNTIPTSHRDREFALNTLRELLLRVFSVVPMVGGAFAAIDYVLSEISAAEQSVDDLEDGVELIPDNLTMQGALYLSKESVELLEEFVVKGQAWVGFHINEFIEKLSLKEICLWLWCIETYLDSPPKGREFDANIVYQFKKLMIESNHNAGLQRAMNHLRIHNP